MIWLLFQMALKSLIRRPVRSGLALLGIIMGIAALFTTMAIGKGSEQKMRETIMSMGKDSIYIHSGNFVGSRTEISRHRRRPLTYQDFLAIRQQIPSIRFCTPYLSDAKMIQYHGNQIKAEVECGTRDRLYMETREIEKGTFFTSYQDAIGARVAVLGAKTAEHLFDRKNPLGELIYIDNYSFKVIGVFEKRKQTFSLGHHEDLDVIVPFFSVWKTVIPREALDNITIIPRIPQESSQVIASAKRILRFRHQLEDQPDDFTIWDTNALFTAAQKSSQTFNHFLILVAGISLLVGGVGIMNIMLVAMAERRVEIGLKMAIGATSANILIQFILEAILLCLFGGIIGIATGFVATYILAYLIELRWAVDWQPIAAILTITSGIGLFFGYYPAYKASKLNPIEALHTA